MMLKKGYKATLLSHNKDIYKDERKTNKLQKIGLILLIIDYIFIAYIIFRTNSISYIYKKPYYRAKYLILYYGISVLSFPTMLLGFITIVRIRNSFKLKMMEVTNVVKTNIKVIILPVIIASLFSLLFKDELFKYAERLPNFHQTHIVTSYYMTLFIMNIYFILRAIVSADYYESYYLLNKTDYRLHFLLAMIVLMAIVVIKFRINHF